MTGGQQPGAPQRSLVGLRVFALTLLVIGAIVLIGTLQITRVGGYSVVGPAAVPMGVAVGLIGLGLAFLARTTVIGDPDLFEHVGAEEAATHWPTVVAQVTLLVAYVLLLGSLGYIVATALFVPAGAWLLGSRRQLRDLAVGIGLALIIYFTFTGVLGLRLPAGLLDPIL